MNTSEWEELHGQGLEKACRILKLNPMSVYRAKKFGQKTVFARFHGMVTLYVIKEGGSVRQTEFVNIPPDSVIKNWLRKVL